jgi:hypothetical protein
MVSTSRILISRWMWNVKAIRNWETKREEHRDECPHWWQPNIDEARSPSFRKISGFVGQGRQVGYNGLAYAVLVSVYDTSDDTRRIQQLDTIANRTLQRLNGPRPGSWWVLSLISLAIVWLEIGMAFMTSYHVPTIGIGCRSMSYLIYGGLSTLPWIMHLFPCFKDPGIKRKAACLLISVLSTLFLTFISFAAVS